MRRSRQGYQAADLLGPGVSVSEVVLEASARLGRLPERDDAFSRQEFRRGLKLPRIEPQDEADA